MTRPEPFELQVPDAAIADLRERLARTRFPDQTPGPPWAGAQCTSAERSSPRTTRAVLKSSNPSV